MAVMELSRHELCGGTHRTEETRLACQAKFERATARLEKTLREDARREDNLLRVPVVDFVRKTRAAGGAAGTWDRIVSALNKDYPPPRDGEKWGIWEVVETYAETLNWPVPVEVRTEMLLERYYTGAYITVHPMQLPGVIEALRDVECLLPGEIRTQEEEEPDGDDQDDY